MAALVITVFLFVAGIVVQLDKADRARAGREMDQIGNRLLREQRQEKFRAMVLAETGLSVEPDGTVVAAPELLSPQLREEASTIFPSDDPLSVEMNRERDAFWSKPYVYEHRGLTLTVTREGKSLRTVVTHPLLTSELVAQMRALRPAPPRWPQTAP